MRQHPMLPAGSAWIRAPACIFLSRDLSSRSDATPLAKPKLSHASQSGRTEKPAKYPKPAICRYGASSLKKNGVPTASRRGRVDGGR